MNFNFKINKYSNFYFFLQNLSMWHSNCKKRYNDTWMNDFSGLKNSEKNLLEEFKFIRQKFGFKNFFEQAFISENPFIILNNNLNIKDYEVLVNIFDMFNEKFNIIYNNDYKLLLEWQEILNNKIKQEIDKNKEIDRLLRVFFNDENIDLDVQIYLLLSNENGGSGGANIDNKSITLEISRFSISNINFVMGVFWHELIHIFYETNFKKDLKKYLKQIGKFQLFSIINETIVSSLFPNGILGNRFYGIGNTNVLHNKLSTTNNLEIISEINSYVSGEKKFDYKLIQLLINYICSKV